jgi:hypothetical protein
MSKHINPSGSNQQDIENKETANKENINFIES